MTKQNMADTTAIVNAIEDDKLKSIGRKILSAERLTAQEGILLFEKASLPFVGSLANFIKRQKSSDKVFFNRNIHIEPTNICVFHCEFCSYSRSYAKKSEGWEYSKEDILNIIRKYDHIPITEVHIVGGVHPKLNFAFFKDLLRSIKEIRPDLHIKGFTPVELDYMFRKASLSVEEGLKQAHEAGLDSLPGGGAEIFAPEIRKKICPDKVDAEGWLKIHKAAHHLGMKTTATMLYGHIETYADRIDHMLRLRNLQDETKGFLTFIPLKFLHENNNMQHIRESSITEDMRLYAISRIFLDNFPHLKAYWPMLGRREAQLLLNYGVDDLDGTIDDSTKIYSMCGSEEQNPAMSTQQLVNLIKEQGFRPIERGTFYNEIHDFSKEDVKEERI